MIKAICIDNVDRYSTKGNGFYWMELGKKDNEELAEFFKSSFDEEIMIVDYDGEIRVGEWENIYFLNDVPQILEDAGVNQCDFWLVYKAYSGDTFDKQTFEDVLKIVEDNDYMVIDAKDYEELGYYLIEELCMLEIPENLKYYFNYEKYGRDYAINANLIEVDSVFIELFR